MFEQQSAGPGSLKGEPTGSLWKRSERSAPWLISICALALMIGCGPPSDKASTSSDTAAASAHPTAADLDKISADAEKGATWVYTEYPDPMGDQPTRMACVSSSDEIQLAGTGTTTTSACVLKAPDGEVQVEFGVNGEGVFRCMTPEVCPIKLRLDSAPAFFADPIVVQDGSSRNLILRYADGVAATMAKSKRLLMEADYVGAPAQVSTLNISHLDLARLDIHAEVPASVAAAARGQMPSSIPAAAPESSAPTNQ
ncbi:MAG: hypothetical protein ACHP84_04685 [Caulobacterales bacterium]